MGRDGSAVAVAADSGKQLWQQPGAPNSSGMIGSASVAVADKMVVLPFASGQISAVQTGTGDPIWNAGVSGQRLGRSYGGMGDVTGDPVIVGNTVYLGTAAGRTVAIDATTGGRLWTAGEGALNPLLVVGGSGVVNDEARLVMDATGEDLVDRDADFVRTNRRNVRRSMPVRPGSGGRATWWPPATGARLIDQWQSGP